MKFTLNTRGVEDVVRSSGTRRVLDGVADRIVSAVEDRAPVETGDFQGSITKTGVEPTVKGARVTVYSKDWAAHLVEFGSANNPAYAPFRRAASALGLALRGGGERR